ncbi:MAG TPA: YdcF family protein [Planctomycetaceae bacterium]|nr:YdcF family protein [Planctomycetaceae bacterium]
MRRFRKLVLFTLLIVAGIIVIRRPLLIAVGRHLDTGSSPHAVDFVVLLPGHEATRAFVVAGLVKKGYAPTAVLIPSKLYGQDASKAQHVIGRDILQSQGIAGDQIIELPNLHDDSTFSNAESLGTFLEKQHADCRLIVVTNDYHTRRSTWAFRQVLKDRMTQIEFVSAPADYHSAETWWHSPRGTEAYLSEYFKLGYYMLRYNRQNRILFLGTITFVVMSGAVVTLRRRKRKQEQRPANLASATEQGHTA